MRELEERGALGEVNHRHFSFMGAIHDPGPLVEETAPEVAAKLVEDEVDAVLLTPS
jgi:D-proline reductase (dithiol) PrdB